MKIGLLLFVLLSAFISILGIAVISSFKSTEETLQFAEDSCINPFIQSEEDDGIFLQNICQQSMIFTVFQKKEKIFTTRCLKYLEAELISNKVTGGASFDASNTKC